MSLLGVLPTIRLDLPVMLMLLAIVSSAIAIVYIKHIGRTEFVQLQKLEYQRDKLNEEWGRLLLEESTWGSPGRVERQARDRLYMVVPTADMTVVIEP